MTRTATGPDFVIKGVSVCDIDGDGRADIVITGSGTGTGVFRLSCNDATPELSETLTLHSVSGFCEMKYDNHVLIDMDFDGDTDIVTVEENQGLFGYGLGLVWYENPEG